MKLILVILFVIASSVSYSQVITNAEYDYPKLVKEDFYSNGNLRYFISFDSEHYSKSEEFRVKECKEYYENGQLSLSMKIKNSVPNGTLVAYWENGNLKRKDLYKNGILVSGKIWDQNGELKDYSEFEIPSQVQVN